MKIYEKLIFWKMSFINFCNYVLQILTRRNILDKSFQNKNFCKGVQFYFEIRLHFPYTKFFNKIFITIYSLLIAEME